MRTGFIGRIGMATAGMVVTVAGLACAPAQASPASCPLPAADRIVALNDIQNLMGRYNHQGTMKGEGTLADLFALRTEGVSWKTPGGPVGIAAMKARFADPDEVQAPGILHMHSMLSPVIEVAGDGETAKGVWDSFGASVNGPDDVGGWLAVKYGVDFVKEDGVWKIWHLQVYPFYSTKYDKSITQTAKERAARPPQPMVAGQTGRDVPRAAGPNGAPPAARPGYVMPASVWHYDGKSTPQGPFIPVPYCHFDPATSY
ncbi:nuclear transport factor 2 family protein [Sphingobium sp.]|uniref:nuclear transport factor 2 family protein n=1 Tax=Sphingobium sp. TaxID=1912891 RepID=UPI0028BE1B5A|nr:nuclear transport factor 2 family protein [Sphingobium sp.]